MYMQEWCPCGDQCSNQMFAQQRYAKINQVSSQWICHAGFMSIVWQADFWALPLLLKLCHICKFSQACPDILSSLGLLMSNGFSDPAWSCLQLCLAYALLSNILMQPIRKCDHAIAEACWCKRVWSVHKGGLAGWSVYHRIHRRGTHNSTTDFHHHLRTW